MDIREAIKLALQSLWQNKMRTVLTLLCMTIAVSSIIAVVTLVNGARTYVTTKFSRYGADVFTVSKMPSMITSSDAYLRYNKRKNVLYDDYAYVRDNCTRCVSMGAMQATRAKVVRGTQSITDCTIRGYTWQMPNLQNLDIDFGRDFTAQDEEHASHVAIIGTDVRDNLFPGIDPLGQELRVDGQPYTVIGVAEKQGSTFGQSQDNWVGIPLPAYQKTYGTAKTLVIYIKAGSAGVPLQEAGDEVRVLMRSRRHDAPGQPDSFELDVNNTLLSFFSFAAASFGAVAGAIALIALVVGGIVIMNIMLVSVTERTREIGVRKSLGARHSDVMMQILIEAVVLAMMGGALGVALGALVTVMLGKIFELSLSITPAYVVLSIAVSSIVGVISGWYPASRAAKLDPVVALRAE